MPSFFFFSFFLSLIPFDFKISIDSLAFRLDIMWCIGSHIDHRHPVIPHARRSTKHWTFVHSIFSQYDWHWLWKHHKAVSDRFCSKQMLPFDRTISTDLWLCSVITWRVFQGRFDGYVMLTRANKAESAVHGCHIDRVIYGGCKTAGCRLQVAGCRLELQVIVTP